MSKSQRRYSINPKKNITTKIKRFSLLRVAELLNLKEQINENEVY